MAPALPQVVAAVLVSEPPLAVTPTSDVHTTGTALGAGVGLGAGVATKPATTTLLSVAFWE
jgi:hypothetical protein